MSGASADARDSGGASSSTTPLGRTATPFDDSLLVARDVVAGYVADLPVVRGASVEVAAGEIVVVLGPNGAGKSTFIKALAGVASVFGGRVTLAGSDITALAAHRLNAQGVAFVPQTSNVFTTLSVDENLRVGGYLLKKELAQRLDQAYARFPDLARRRRHLGDQLSGGQRQMLAMARALMTAPRLILLDEPSAGLSPLMVSEVFAQIRAIADSGVAVLMVEQNVKAGLRIADRGLILVNGQVAHTGAASALMSDPAVAQAYLGKHLNQAAAPASQVMGGAASVDGFSASRMTAAGDTTGNAGAPR
ncbi:MAG: transporter ATP-binding protein [Rhizobacter sp.]|nr:transporter ATP-binding protein [Rhizobacter sp.]